MDLVIWTDSFVSYNNDDYLEQFETIRKTGVDNSEVARLKEINIPTEEQKIDFLFNDGKPIEIEFNRIELRKRDNFARITLEIYNQNVLQRQVVLTDVGIVVDTGTYKTTGIKIITDNKTTGKVEIALYKPGVNQGGGGCIVS